MAILRFHVCPVDKLGKGWNRGMAILYLHPPCPIPSSHSPKNNSSRRISCSIQSKSIVAGGANSKKEYKPGVFDDIFLNVFRSKMAQEIGWDSEKPGYDGLIDVAHRIMTGRSNIEATEAAVFVEKCRYLEESKCVGVCINTCKLPTQIFFKEHMGIPLVMEPNFDDYSCQFKFGALPPPPEGDSTLKQPCLQVCPTANRRREIGSAKDALKCPKS